MSLIASSRAASSDCCLTCWQPVDEICEKTVTAKFLDADNSRAGEHTAAANTGCSGKACRCSELLHELTCIGNIQRHRYGLVAKLVQHDRVSQGLVVSLPGTGKSVSCTAWGQPEPTAAARPLGSSCCYGPLSRGWSGRLLCCLPWPAREASAAYMYFSVHEKKDGCGDGGVAVTCGSCRCCFV